MSKHEPEANRPSADDLLKAKNGTRVHRRGEPGGDHRGNLPARYRRHGWHPPKPGESEHASFVRALVGAWPVPGEGFLARPEVARVLSSLRSAAREARAVS